jgi:hypothetical protein
MRIIEQYQRIYINEKDCVFYNIKRVRSCSCWYLHLILVGYFERYMFLLALCGFLEDNLKTKANHTFRFWLESKSEIFNILKRARDPNNPLSLFLPCENLATTTVKAQDFVAWGAPKQDIVTELDKYVIKSRNGQVLVQNTILKEDHWFKSTTSLKTIKGASNFRYASLFLI